MSEQKAVVEVSKAPPPMRADGAGVMPIVPRDLAEAGRYAQGLAKAEMVPDCFREGGRKSNPVNVPMVVAAVLKSLELGMSPQEGIANMYPVNGRLTLWGNGAQAMVQRSGYLEDFTVEKVGKKPDETTPRAKWPNDYGFKVRAKRVGVTSYFENIFTVGDARTAGLWGKAGPWQLYPDRMLFNRARAYVFRDGFSDALSGMGVYEELQDTIPEASRAKMLSSALDDDITEVDMVAMDPDNLPEMVNKFLDGLQTVTTLEELMDYQSDQKNSRILKAVQEHDPESYEKMIAAGGHRYQEIDKLESEAREAIVETEDEPT